MRKKGFKLIRTFATVALTAMVVTTVPMAATSPMQVQAAVDATTRAEIESALYNAEYYEKANDDVAVALNYDPAKLYEHWLNYGMAEGRNASMVFNAKYYLEKNPEVKAKVGNDYVAAYEHFVNEGLQAGLESSPVFSVKYYLEANTDVAAAFNGDYVSAAKHFNENAIAEGRSGSGNFDYTVYRACNTDVEELYGDYIEGYYIHYINHGRAEGRTGGLASNGGGADIDVNAASYRIFDAAFYLEKYPALATSVGTDADALYQYWMKEGISKGQTASPVIVPEEYLELNKDVADAFGNDYAAAINHFLTAGITEGRTGSKEFDYSIYKACNTDVGGVFDADIVGYYFHYVKYGKAENRTAAVYVPTTTPVPSVTPIVTATPVPSVTPIATATPVPTATPIATATPVPTATPGATATPAPTGSAVPDLGEFPTMTEVNGTATGIEVFDSEEEANYYILNMILDNYSGFYVMAEDLSMLHTAEEYMWLYPEITLEIDSLTKYKNGYLIFIGAAKPVYEIDVEHMYALRTGDTSILDERELAAYNRLFSITEELGLDDMETDIEKIKAVHDYLVLNVAYDLDQLQYGTNKAAHYVEGTVLDGLAVCSGYASTFRLLMEMQDITCDYVMNADHAWNLVELDGKWYVMDVTWDDPVPDKPGQVKHDFFMVTEEIIANAGGHDGWYCECGKPHVCNNEEYLLYPVKDFVCTTEEEAISVMQKQADATTITLVYPSDGALSDELLINLVREELGLYRFGYAPQSNYRPGYNCISIILDIE